MKNYLINTGETKKEFVIHSGEDWVVSSRGTAISATLAGELPNIPPATLRISSGGVALYTEVDLGELIVSSGGVASHTSVYGYQGSAKMYVESCGSADNTSVYASGYCLVKGIATNNLIYGKNACMYMGSGGSASRTTVSISGCFYVNGSADDNLVDDRGLMYLSRGGLAYRTTVSSDGSVAFCDGGSAAVLDILSGGTLFVSKGSSGNYLSSATLYSGASAKVGGKVALSRFVACGDVFVLSGGVMSSVQNDPSNLVVMDKGKLVVSDGGVANGFTISSGASFALTSEGKITGKMTIQNGAVISSVWGTVDFDLTQTSAGANAALVNNLSLLDNANLLRRPSAYTITVDGAEGSGVYKVANGASDFNATVTVMNTSGNELGTLTANGLDSVLYGGRKYVLNLAGSTLSVVVAEEEGDDKIFTGVVSSGLKYISSGCSAVGAQVIGTGMLSVLSKGSVINTTFRDGGMLVVSSGAKARGVTLGENGSALVWQDVNISNTVVDGGLLSINKDGWAYQLTNNGQSIVSSNTIVKNYGVMNIYDGGHVSGAYVLDDGYAEVKSGGEFVLGKIVNASVCVLYGGFVSRMNVEDGGVLKVESGGIARHVNVSSGGVLTGVLREAEELRFYGGTLDLNIAKASDGNEFLVDEQSFIRIEPLQNYTYNCTLTIDNSQEAGTYNLIECATGFDKSITVRNLDGEDLGTLTIDGESITIGALNYTLNQDVDGSLSVSLVQGSGGQGGDGPDPMPILPDAYFIGDFNGDGYEMLAVRYDSTISIYQNGVQWGGLTLDYGWDIAGVGDFNGDGFDDFLRVSDEGYVVGEMSNGDGTFSPQVLNFLNEGWNILGIGDFDTTGYDDVLIANPTAASETVGLIGYWESGSTWVLINGYSDEWNMISTGDFNGDGNCDMLWKNSFVGDDEQVYNAYCTWLVGLPEEFGPGGPTQDWFIVSVANPDEWNFLCAGDFDGDKTNDIAMINNEGVVGIWGVQDGTLSSWSILSAVTPEWQLVGVGDFNADGTDDIAWCSSTTGQVGAWIVQDKELASWQVLANIGY